MSVANNLTGKTLSNRYEILRPLGEGGMGKVYLAKDKRFGKQVVVKVPTMEAGDKDFKDRFMREIASLATLEHLHIVTTVDWGEIEGIPFLVLRYLSGGSLRDRITDAQGYYKPMPLEGLNQWLPQIASALDFIHTKNWVHRDLKPDNILFDEAGNSYLADFGIAKALEGAPMGVKTTMGAFIGTPQYMAPEMHLGKGIGPRADQFGLAVLVYEALAGKIPFAGTTPTAIFVEVMQGKARPIHELVPGIPLEKSNALMKGITKEPRDRYGSCVEFANAVTGSMLARGSSSAGNETPSRVVIPGTKMETPKKADIPGTRMETPSKPEILGIKNETPTKPVIAGTRLETHSQPEITGTNLETPSNRGSNPEVRLLGEDYLTKEGQLLAQVCRDLVEAGKVTKELFLEARKFCKSNDVTGMLGGVLLAEKIESIVKAGHVSKEISQEIVSLARDTLGLGKPVIAGTRTERNGVKLPANITEESFEEPKFSSIRFNSSNAKGSTKELFIESELYKFLKGGGAVVLLLGVLVFLFIIGALIYAGITSSWSKPSIINLADGIVSIEKDMVMVPAGRFIMGSPESEKGRYIDETQHEVTITNHFYMGKYEITQEQWETVMGNNPSSRDKGAKLPVTDVSWEDCQEFIKKLNAKTNGGYRLPTEAEWEYACRAETTTAYSFGEDITPKDANYDESKIDKPVAVGSYKPNAFGLYDMHGNVWEWCNDWYGSLQNVEVRDSKGPATGERRVLRGGSFYIDGSKARSSGRFFYTPTYRVRSNGFRLAKTINPSDLLKPNIKAFLLKLKQEEEAKAKQTELVKLKQEEESKAKQTELVKLKQEEEAKAKQTELVKLKQEEESKAKQTELVKLKQKEEAKFAAIEKEMVLVPAGKFMMGSPASEKGRFHEETHHEVTLTKPFYMGKYEVTQEQYEAVMGKNPGDTKGAKLPVTDVSWYDCQEFIKKLNANTKGGYRLPTDAEWEYACRAGTSTAYSYGDSLTKSDANIDGVSPKTVGNYKPNEFGLYDLHGNVWEWCEDWKADYPAGAVTDPKGPGTGTYRVLRGGSFINLDSAARSSVRRYLEPSDRDLYYGFRLARNP